MFGDKRYMTKGIDQGLPLDLILFIWKCIDALKAISNGNMDYLQVFELKTINQPDVEENQMIIHRTEVPEYSKSYALCVDEPITDKVYVIDSEDYCTMLLASEY